MKEKDNNVNLKEKILKVATEEFANLGYNSTSTNVICRKSEVSKGLLYHYYSSKKEMYLTVVKGVIESFKANVIINMDRNKEKAGVDYISEYFNCKFSFFGRNPLASKIIAMLVLNNEFEEAEELFKEFQAYNNNIIYEILENIDFNPKFQREKAFELIVMIGEKLEEKHMRDIEDKPKEIVIEEFRENHRLMLEMLFEGIDKRMDTIKN